MLKGKIVYVETDPIKLMYKLTRGSSCPLLCEGLYPRLVEEFTGAGKRADMPITDLLSRVVECIRGSLADGYIPPPPSNYVLIVEALLENPADLTCAADILEGITPNDITLKMLSVDHSDLRVGIGYRACLGKELEAAISAAGQDAIDVLAQIPNELLDDLLVVVFVVLGSGLEEISLAMSVIPHRNGLAAQMAAVLLYEFVGPAFIERLIAETSDIQVNQAVTSEVTDEVLNSIYGMWAAGSNERSDD